MKKSKKLVSLLLALAFALSLMAMPAMAATKENDVQPRYATCPECTKGKLSRETFTYDNEMLPCPKGGKHLVIHVTKWILCASCPFTRGPFEHDVIDCDRCQ